MLRSVKLQNNMIHNPVKVRPNDNVFKAIDKLIAYKVSGVCVVDEHNTLLGILSELDCMKAILSSVYNESHHVGQVGEFMTKEVISAKISDNIVDVASDMLKHKHRRRPVIDNNGKLLGQITCRQLLRAVSEFSSKEKHSRF